MNKGTISSDHGTDVCLVAMPYSSIERPSAALGTLQAILEDAGISTKSCYESLHFAEKIGIDRYEVHQITRAEDLVGEWTFRRAAFPDFQPDDNEYLDQLMDRFLVVPQNHRDSFPDSTRSVLHEIREAAEAFIEESVQRILSHNPRVVGCTSTFQQHIASLAILRRIRQERPDIVTMLGGSNCDTIMGMTTHRNFDWVDYVVAGEADDLIVDLVRAALEYGKDAPPDALPHGVFGPAHRTGRYLSDETNNDRVPRATVTNLDGRPIPSYQDYFDALHKSPLTERISPGLPVETSRGCWWGQKKHCTFCGLNGSGMTYRRLDPSNVMTVFDNLSKKHGINKFEVVDNILDMRGFDTYLPDLADRNFSLFYETKSNLQRHHVSTLKEAGIRWIQPGIESLSSSILKLMDKGAQGWMHVQLLKWVREDGIRLSYSILFDFPGEDDSEYDRMADLVPSLTHLQPPLQTAQIRFDRYSPYHFRADEFDLKLIPSRFYPYIFPLDNEQILDQCVFFEGEGRPDYLRTPFGSGVVGDSRPGLKRLREQCEQWSKSFWSPTPHLLCEEVANGVVRVLDTREVAQDRITVLSETEAAVLDTCHDAPKINDVVSTVIDRTLKNTAVKDIESAVESLLGRQFVMELDDRLISLTLKGDIPALMDKREFPGGSYKKVRSTGHPVLTW